MPNIVTICRRGPPKWGIIAIFDQYLMALGSMTGGVSSVANKF